MIVFLGCSYTWGHGLAFERWIIEEGKTQEYCEKFLPANQRPQELFSYKDDEYRKQNHFPALVAKELDKPYVSKFGNGGSNYQILEILKGLKHHFGSDIHDVIELFVIQFTDFYRDTKIHRYLKEDELLEFDNLIQTEISKQLEMIDRFIYKEFDKRWYGFSWLDDLGNILKEKYPKNYIPIMYNESEYDNFEILIKDDTLNFSLKSKYNRIGDDHFSLEGHKLIADSILAKINNSI